MKELGGKIEILAERLSNEIRVMDERLSGKIDASDERLSGKIDTLDARLSGEIGKLDERTKHMPTKFGVASIVTAVMAFFTAVSLFSSQILAALGLGS